MASSRVKLRELSKKIMETAHTEEDGPKLSQIFDNLWGIYDLLETTSESTSSYNIQV